MVQLAFLGNPNELSLIELRKLKNMSVSLNQTSINKINFAIVEKIKQGVK